MPPIALCTVVVGLVGCLFYDYANTVEAYYALAVLAILDGVFRKKFATARTASVECHTLWILDQSAVVAADEFLGSNQATLAGDRINFNSILDQANKIRCSVGVQDNGALFLSVQDA